MAAGGGASADRPGGDAAAATAPQAWSRPATLAAALVGMQVGAATVASRFAIAEVDPVTLGLLRYAIGVICLAPFVLAAGRVRFAAGDLAPMMALGIVQFALLIWLFNLALQRIPAARVAIVFSAFPLLTMIFAALLGRERLTPAKTAGVLLTMAGVSLALGGKAGAAPGGAAALGAAAGAQDILGLAGHPIARWAAAWLGEAAAFAAAACGAICSVLYRPYLQRYPALAVSAFAMLGSVAALAIAASVNGIFAAPPRPSAAAWAAIVFVGVSSGIGYFALLWAYARASPTRVAVFQALAPLTAAALGWLFLGEAVSATFLAGLAAVMAGIVVAHR